MFWLNLHSIYLEMTKCYPHSIKGQYIYSNQLTNFKIIILWFLGKLCNLRQRCLNLHLLHGFAPTSACPTKHSIERCLGYIVFTYQPNSNQLGVICTWDQQRYIAPKLWRWQMKSFGLWTGSIVNQLWAYSHIWINQKTKNLVDSKLSMSCGST